MKAELFVSIWELLGCRVVAFCYNGICFDNRCVGIAKEKRYGDFPRNDWNGDSRETAGD